MQQKIFYAILLLPTLFGSCSKTDNAKRSASLSIVNGINNSNPLVTNFEPVGPKATFSTELQYYATANQIPYAGSWESGSYVGMVPLSLFQYPDSSVSVWSGTLSLQPGSIHTLFLSGDTSSVDTLFTTDIIPYYPVTDSVTGIRFINLAKGSLPMSVNLQGNLPSQSEFNNLGYQQVSSFKPYSANSNAPGQYNFEIRDLASGNLLYTFQWSYSQFKNNTAAIIGSESPTSSTPLQVVQVNDY
jgi:hypothetical protein